MISPTDLIAKINSSHIQVSIAWTRDGQRAESATLYGPSLYGRSALATLELDPTYHKITKLAVDERVYSKPWADANQLIDIFLGLGIPIDNLRTR